MVGQFELLVKNYPGGNVSSFMHKMAIGDTIRFKHIKFKHINFKHINIKHTNLKHLRYWHPTKKGGNHAFQSASEYQYVYNE